MKQELHDKKTKTNRQHIPFGFNELLIKSTAVLTWRITVCADFRAKTSSCSFLFWKWKEKERKRENIFCAVFNPVNGPDNVCEQIKGYGDKAIQQLFRSGCKWIIWTQSKRLSQWMSAAGGINKNTDDKVDLKWVSILHLTFYMRFNNQHICWLESCFYT